MRPLSTAALLIGALIPSFVSAAAYHSTPTAHAGTCAWKHLGCYSDSSRRLLRAKSFVDDHGMTVEKCLGKCDGFEYAMVEYGQ